MFDVGFSEILFIIVLAIVILGPEGLPKLGRYLGQFLRTWQGFKNDFQFRLNDTDKADSKPKPSGNGESQEAITATTSGECS